MSDISQIAGALIVAVSVIWLPGVLIIKASDRPGGKRAPDGEAAPPET